MSTKISVVLIEDHAVTLRGIKQSLEEQGDLEVVGSAENADDGYKLVQTLRPDILLLDLHLPGKQGPKSLLQRFLPLEHTKTIVFSADDRVALVQLVLRLGTAGYLLKTEPCERIVEAIRKVVNGTQPVVSRELVRAQASLTDAERDLLESFARGKRYAEIAEMRGTSWHTVKKQCELLMIKLDVNSREELISWAVSNGYGSL